MFNKRIQDQLNLQIKKYLEEDNFQEFNEIKLSDVISEIIDQKIKSIKGFFENIDSIESKFLKKISKGKTKVLKIWAICFFISFIGTIFFYFFFKWKDFEYIKFLFLSYIYIILLYALCISSFLLIFVILDYLKFIIKTKNLIKEIFIRFRSKNLKNRFFKNTYDINENNTLHKIRIFSNFFDDLDKEFKWNKFAETVITNEHSEFINKNWKEIENLLWNYNDKFLKTEF